MDKILVKSATLVFPGHDRHGQAVDVLIVNGVVSKVEGGDAIHDEHALTIDGKHQYLSPGFFDLNVNFGEPGLETKETISTGCTAAVAGGYTGLAVQPNTVPALHSRGEIAMIVNLAKGNLVSVYPIGAISKNRSGDDLAELYDMQQAGAVAFSNGNKSVQQAGLMSRALLYCKGFEGLVMSYAEDASIANGAKMNEGITSTFLGMKGNPNLAEELMVSRDLYLAAYNNAPIHFSTISTKESVELIRLAKKKGIKVTCDVAAHHLVLTEESVSGFDSNYKVSPPLRTDDDVKALKDGLLDGTIDAIVSQHTPHEVEFKKVEFEIAKNGIIGLQTVLPLLLKAGLPVDLIVEKLAIAPRAILRLAPPTLAEGSDANFVLFNTEESWTFDAYTNRSKSTNSPYYGSILKGRVNLVLNNKQVYNSNQE
ncbi:dihydroorotase [Olivibacter sp. SDN3]|uniref:dihydroorotase n=1 Tax=Olivibacter sp. SDN3 TaxID=2764720 RepID=UPI0016518910|nr:dihydroorotase [Olivibacter sp. SDN3]QNL49936.1 dihydroorotase [Olivibacter sp. SDN3]